MDEVPSADFRRVDVKVAGQHVHGALDQVDALRSTVPAVGALGRVVGIDGVDFKRGLSNAVDTCGDDGGGLSDDWGCALGKRAQVRGVVEAERLDAAVTVRGHLKPGGFSTRMAEGKELFRARGGPLDGQSEVHRCDGQEEVLHLPAVLGAESSAHVRRDGANLLGRKPQHLRHLRSQLMRALNR